MSVCACACVCVCERKIERGCVLMREREREWVNVHSLVTSVIKAEKRRGDV